MHLHGILENLLILVFEVNSPIPVPYVQVGSTKVLNRCETTTSFKALILVSIRLLLYGLKWPCE